MNQPLFSVCIPNYNYARYIAETIQSVLNQTCQDFEIIIADNASTDDSVAVVESFRDERIRIVRNQYNIGFAPNLQRASELARGQYMLMLSSDDRMLPNALETYFKIIQLEGEKAIHSVIYSEANQIDAEGNIRPYTIKQAVIPFYRNLPNTVKELPEGKNYYVYEGKDVLRETVKRLCPAGPFLSMAYSRSLFESVEGYNSVHLTDPDVHFTFKILQKSPSVIWVRESLFEYRVHGNNQLDLQVKQASIKKPIDKYLYTVDLSDKLLKSLELDRNVIIVTFVEKYLVNEMFHYLARGNLKQAYSSFVFGMATYPGHVLRIPRSYGLVMLLVLGPFSAPMTRLIRFVYRLFGGKD